MRVSDCAARAGGISARSCGRRAFGFRRSEALAAVLNAVSLWIIAAWILLEAYHCAVACIAHNEGAPIRIEWMLIVGGIGLAVNIVAARVLHSSARRGMNVVGDYGA